MKSPANRRKLRNLFISKDLQRPMIIAHMAYLLFVFVVIIATVLSPYYTDIFTADELLAQYFSAKTFIVLLGRLSIASLFIAFISFFHFVIFTHKFCGPLVNIGHTIARISEGDFSRKIYLRNGDFLKNEAKQINAMMNSLSNSIAIIKKENQLLIEDLEEYKQADGTQADMEGKLKSIRNRANRCRMQLDHFNMDNEAANAADSGQCPDVVGDNLLQANRCL